MQMSRHIITLPSVITQDAYPLMFPDASYQSLYLPDELTQAVGLTQGIDPRYELQPVKMHKFKYTNNNGIDVEIVGTYNNVMSTVDVLNTYPPTKRDCNDDERFNLLFGTSTGKTNVPKVGVQKKGDHLLVTIDNKVYSGSGCLIMVVGAGVPFSVNNAKFVLFRDVNTSNPLYQDLGGRLDEPKPPAPVDRTILFTNAKKEAEEESMKLFNLTKESADYVDIETEDTNTYYRIYLYLFVTNNPNGLSKSYDANKSTILTNYYPSNFGKAYRETSALDLFDYQTFINKLATSGYGQYNISSSVFQKIDGSNVNVKGRTIKAIAKFNSDKIFDKLFARTVVQRVDPVNSGGYEVISLSS